MRKILQNIFMIICILLSMTGCIRHNSDTDIVILFTSDLRGNFMGYNYLEDKQYSYSLSAFSTLVKEQRVLHGNRLLVLDAGGRLMSSPSLLYSTMVDTLSEPPLYAMERYIGYDGCGIGLSERQEREVIAAEHHDPSKQAPIICANVVDRTTGEPVFMPYKIFDRGGIKVAVLGITERMQSRWVLDEAWVNTTDQDPVQSIRQWIPEILRQQPDVIIGLFYGLEVTPEMAAPFDAVLTSRGKNPFTQTVCAWDNHYVPVIGAARHGTHVGMVRVHVSPRTDTSEGQPRFDKEVSTTLINMEDYPRDEVFVRDWTSYHETLVNWVNRPISYLGEKLTCNDGLFGSDKYRRMIHNAQLEYSGADISMASCLNPNDVFEEGEISLHTIYDLYPHDNQMMTIKMTIDEVRRFLDYGYSMQYRTVIKGEASRMGGVDPFMYRYDRKGHLMYNEAGYPRLLSQPSNFTSAAGIIYDVDITKPAGSRVTIHGFEDGRQLEIDKMYNVCINSFQAGNDFISKGLGWDESMLVSRTVPTTSYSVRRVLYEYFSKMDTVKIKSTDNWRIVPSEFEDFGLIEEGYHAAW